MPPSSQHYLRTRHASPHSRGLVVHVCNVYSVQVPAWSVACIVVANPDLGQGPQVYGIDGEGVCLGRSRAALRSSHLPGLQLHPRVRGSLRTTVSPGYLDLKNNVSALGAGLLSHFIYLVTTPDGARGHYQRQLRNLEVQELKPGLLYAEQPSGLSL